MCNSKKWHLDANQKVVESDGNVLGVGIWTEAGNDTCGDKGRDRDRLPKGEEKNSFNAQEFRNRSII